MSFSLQVVKASIVPTACMSEGSILPSNFSSYSEYSGSLRGGVAQSIQSKPYLMCTATDAASAIMDFSKQKVDDGVVDSPPERRAGITPVASPSPLKRMGSFGEPKTDLTLQQKLYANEGVDIIQVKEVALTISDLGQPSRTLFKPSSMPVQPCCVPVQPSCTPICPSSTPAKRRRIQSTQSRGAIDVKKPPVPSTRLQTRSLCEQPRLPSSASTHNRRKSLSSREGDDTSRCVSCGSHPSSILQKSKGTDYGDYYANSPFAPRRKAILAAHAKVKAEEALRLKAQDVGSTVSVRNSDALK